MSKREEVSVAQLSDMQRYLGEETIEDYEQGYMTRRRMLRRLVLICGSSAAAVALLAACGNNGAEVTSLTATADITNGTIVSGNYTPFPNSGTGSTPAPGTTSAPSGSLPPPATSAARGPLTVAENDPAVQGSMITANGNPNIMAYLARPAAAGTYPGVMVIHENRGLTDHIKDVSRRLAKAGYIALAPDLASRVGGTAKLPTDNVTGYFANAKTEDLLADLNTAFASLQTQAGVLSGKYGTVGFCFGGGLTLSFAAIQPKLTAAVSYYGPVPNPVSQMSNTQAAILGQYGALDTRVDAGIPGLAQTLQSSGKTFVQKVYDGANHAFNNDTGPSYNEAAAVAAWQATLDWFKKYLAA